jgi:hypothetical protein
MPLIRNANIRPRTRAKVPARASSSTDPRKSSSQRELSKSLIPGLDGSCLACSTSASSFCTDCRNPRHAERFASRTCPRRRSPQPPRCTAKRDPKLAGNQGEPTARKQSEPLRSASPRIPVGNTASPDRSTTNLPPVRAPARSRGSDDSAVPFGILSG